MAFLWFCKATDDALPENNNVKSVLTINVPTSSKYGDLDNHQCFKWNISIEYISMEYKYWMVAMYSHTFYSTYVHHHGSKNWEIVSEVRQRPFLVDKI